MASFNAKTVDLIGSNLIEASAGTGKTYSVAILVLRLLLEKKVPLEKILMVTFTNAAVAELEDRIRRFVRLAQKYAYGEPIPDSTVKEVVGTPDAAKKALLKKAVQSLDSLSVLTIHSFCQKVITNNPFETGQSFETEMMADSTRFIEFAVNEHWRKHINTIENMQVFGHLNSFLIRDEMKVVVARVLGDKTYLCRPINKELVLEEITLELANLHLAEMSFTAHVKSHWHDIQTRKYKFHAQNYVSKYPTTEKFIQAFIKDASAPKGYFQTYFADELALAEKVVESTNRLNAITNDYAYFTYSEIIDSLKEQVLTHKHLRNVITYDDLIDVLHKAVDRQSINHLLLSQYDAVFIDEFQDTDRKQFEIFSGIFNHASGKVVFYIGDPKQSIYSFRKADIATYKKAREEVHHIHEMNENFRSTNDLIHALNRFFGIENPFYDDQIQYHPVNKGPNPLAEMKENGKKVAPLTVYSFEKNDEIKDFVRDEIHRLLVSAHAQIGDKPIRPSDIAVLVRTNTQAADIKKMLSDKGIPAITISTQSVLASAETDSLVLLMKTVLQPRRELINTLLLNPCFGYDSKKISCINDDEHLDVFRDLHKDWIASGIYYMIFSFLSKYDTRTHCLDRGIGGQRSLVNFFQLAEILQKRVRKSNCSPDELIVWLQCEKQTKSDEYEQRIETEEDAVQIVTIHKSKGLTYKVVLAPFLDLKIPNYSPYDFRDQEGYKFTHQLTEEQEKLWHDQNEQENRRLIYVALTRAQYKVYICENACSKSKESSLKPFLGGADEAGEQPDFADNPAKSWQPDQTQATFTPRTPSISGEEVKNTFAIHSFSGLSRKHHSAPFEKQELAEAYDRFIFQELGRGATVGTALHSIFERLNFNQPHTWQQTLDDAAKFYPNILKEESLNHFKTLVEHTMNANIALDGQLFQLNQIAAHKKLPELQFYFSVNQVPKARLNDILGEEADLAGDVDIQGLMTGFVDLLFEYQGKYYILDWKSNHLGNSMEDYNQPGLETAMKASNYNLQYMIYTVAVKRWLESRISDFDYDTHFGGVIYLFLRGIRQSHLTGIFTAKPQKELIEKVEGMIGRLGDG